VNLSIDVVEGLVERIRSWATTTEKLHEIVEKAIDDQLIENGWEKMDHIFWHKGEWTVGRDTAIYLENHL
jgi:hypothetical protein